MKRNIFKILSFFTVLLLVFSCQNFDRDPLGEYPLDGAGITFISPNANGSTVIQSIQPTTSTTVKFEVTDDIAIKNIVVKYDNTEIYNQSSFTDVKHVVVDNLVVSNIGNGDHNITIIATDSDNNVITKTAAFTKKQADPYVKKYDGEVFYMPFDGNFYEYVSATPATEVGSPGYGSEGAQGTTNSYVAGTGNYLTFPTTSFATTEISGSFWYKVSGTPDRAGLLAVGTAANQDRTKGFRLFREGSGTQQRIKLNVGTGSAESWNDGGVLPVGVGGWVHIAFTISSTQSKIYFNGELQNTANFTSPINWTGTTAMSIGSGAPTFAYYNHLSDTSKMDELRMFNKALTQFEVQTIAGTAYTPLSGETLYMPFDGKYNNRVTNVNATTVGTPSFAGIAKVGSNSYKGAADSYLNYPSAGLFSTSFTVAFWYKVNASPDRAGLVVVGDPSVAEDRNKGFRIFREGSATEQRIKLNLGLGAAGESWNDGGVINVAEGAWVHVAVAVSPTSSKIYLNGVLKTTSNFTSPVSWTNTNTVNIGAGGPSFSYWNHLSDQSAMDELRFFNRTLTDQEILQLMN
ncbi:LamG domain-containing protein [uncultured Chryseobacterium sp.]|uniref:LamG domain-containing protein n=1 Tax=uncultured Chryseobacterium sp. TaxID=259322 RepID=UPI0026019F5C|nr:LamG domain-containing protein [uncultured Chryseobacterium sp.]